MESKESRTAKERADARADARAARTQTGSTNAQRSGLGAPSTGRTARTGTTTAPDAAPTDDAAERQGKNAGVQHTHTDCGVGRRIRLRLRRRAEVAIPAELWAMVLERLDPDGDLLLAAFVCQEWHRLVQRMVGANRAAAWPRIARVDAPRAHATDGGCGGPAAQRGLALAAHLVRRGRMQQLAWARLHGCPWDASTFAAAAAEGALQHMRWLAVRECPWDARACAAAAEHGHVAAIEWLWCSGCDLRVSEVCRAAARGNQRDVLAWLWNRYDELLGGTGARSPMACSASARDAAAVGDAPWLPSCSCAVCAPLAVTTTTTTTAGPCGDGRPTRRREPAPPRMRPEEHGPAPRRRHSACLWKHASIAASAAGHVDVLRWLDWRGWCPCASGAVRVCWRARHDGFGRHRQWRWRAPAWAAARGHIAVLAWFHERDALTHVYICAYAASEGRMEALAWLHERGVPWDESVTAYAAAGGHLDVLRWLIERQGAPWDDSMGAYAARHGHMHVLEWLASCSWFVWSASVMAEAAAGGAGARVLRWLRVHDCPWDERTTTSAAGIGDVDALRYAVGDGCPWTADAYAAATVAGHLDVLRWARRAGLPGWDRDYLLQFISLGTMRRRRLAALRRSDGTGAHYADDDHAARDAASNDAHWHALARWIANDGLDAERAHAHSGDDPADVSSPASCYTAL